MGLYKKMMMDKEMEKKAYPFSKLPTYNVSFELFENKLVKEYIQEGGEVATCHYSGRDTIVLPFRDIVEYINNIVLTYYEHPDEGVYFDSSSKDDDYGKFLTKVGGGYVVPSNRKLYDDIGELLCENGFRVRDDKLFEDICNAIGNIYLIQKDPYALTEDEERLLSWIYLSRNAIKYHKSGWDFKRIMHYEHVKLYELIQAIQLAHVPLLKKTHLKLFRCVNYMEKLQHVHFSDLTSPPKEYTKNLRMSIQGDSIFYGAEKKETALREAQNGTGDTYSYIGTFETRHGVNVLDLSDISKNLTIFDYDIDQYPLLVFLNSFCEEISKPIKERTDSPDDYIPTQLLSYYFRNCLKLYNQGPPKQDLDGIIYRSCKDGTKNAALFYDQEESAKHLKLLSYDVIHHGVTEHNDYLDSPFISFFD